MGRWTTRVAVPGALLCALSAAPSVAQSGRGQVAFAEPADPVFRALYPGLSPATGLTPVAEPEVAIGRRPPRRPEREECDAGFRIAEPATKEWRLAGADYLLASFFVTTENRPGVVAPCYQPEPWVCVLERKPGSGVAPVDCTTVEQDVVFPGVSSLDTAPFRLTETEKAFGVRLSQESGSRFETETREALVLFRLHERRLTQVLALAIGLTHDQFGEGDCSRELILGVETTRTGGFFDWRIRTGKKTGSLPCSLETGRYRWDGGRYVKAGAKPSGR
jgi:hypothetical protein